MEMYHNFFIPPSANGQLDYFQILAIVNNAVMNIRMKTFLNFSTYSFSKPSSSECFSSFLKLFFLFTFYSK